MGDFDSGGRMALLEANRKVTQFGGPYRENCGARTRNGGFCGRVPVREGNGRCLSHAGPKAARAYRERQKRAFEAGKISAEEWNRAESRRSANRLRERWKKDPWVSGTTIDLGAHERAFQAALGSVDSAELPPAALDWLRWRYRRTQIDRRDDGKWHKALQHDLPRRVGDAGPCPEGGLSVSGEGGSRAAKPRTWMVGAVEGAEGASRRSLPDRPKAPKVQRGKGYGRRGRPQTQPADEGEYADLMRVYRENRAILQPIMAVMQGEQKQLAVLRTLRSVLTRPDDVQARQRWLVVFGASQGR